MPMLASAVVSVLVSGAVATTRPPTRWHRRQTGTSKGATYYFVLVILSRFGRLCSHWQRLLESSGQGRDLLHSAGTSLDRIDAANVN